jgi:hypothetical protein
MNIKTEKQLRMQIRMMLENALNEKKLKKEKETKFRTQSTEQQEEIDPPITDLTKAWIEDQTRYKSMVMSALKRADGHIPIAATELGVSSRTLRRHINGNFAVGELDDILAPPGPDPNWDVEQGKKISRDKINLKKKKKKFIPKF